MLFGILVLCQAHVLYGLARGDRSDRQLSCDMLMYVMATVD